MKVTKITVDNYRILKEFELDLEDPLSLVIGKNNCGKTSLLYILEKFLGSRSSVNSFTWDDFSISFQKNLKALLEKECLSEEEEKSFPIGISLNLHIEYGKHDNTSNISDIMMDLEIDANTVVIEFRYSLSQIMFESLKEDYQNHLPQKNGAEKAKTNVREKCLSDYSDFMKDGYKKYFKIDKNAREYDHVNRCAGSLRKTIENDDVIERIIHFKSINARRTMSNSETNNALSRLSSEYYTRIEEKDSPVQAIEEFKKLVAETDGKLDLIYQDVFRGIIEKIKTFGGIKEGDTDIKILSSLQRRELLRGNTTVKYAHDDNHHLPESHNGSGGLEKLDRGISYNISLPLTQFQVSHE